ncbi:MAG: hypothetical protein Q6373_005495 [Candidatus Sigynarchaeota archaeon]
MPRCQGHAARNHQLFFPFMHTWFHERRDFPRLPAQADSRHDPRRHRDLTASIRQKRPTT